MDVRRVTISESLAQHVQVCKVSLGRGDLPPDLLYQEGCGGLQLSGLYQQLLAGRK